MVMCVATRGDRRRSMPPRRRRTRRPSSPCAAAGPTAPGSSSRFRRGPARGTAHRESCRTTASPGGRRRRFPGRTGRTRWVPHPRSWGTPARRSPASARRRRVSAAASRRNARAPRPHTARRRADRAAASRSDRRGIECSRSTTCRARAAVRTTPSSYLPADDRSSASPVHPPDNACNTNTSSASPTASARRTRSATRSPLM